MDEFRRKQLIAINARIRSYRAALDQAILSGASSASISTGGNSQSYTRYSLADIRAEIASLERAKRLILNSGRSRRTSPDFS